MLSNSLVYFSHRGDQTRRQHSRCGRLRAEQSGTIPSSDRLAMQCLTRTKQLLGRLRGPRLHPPRTAGPRGGDPALGSAFPSQGARSLPPRGSGTPRPPPEKADPAQEQDAARGAGHGLGPGGASPSSEPPPWPRSGARRRRSGGRRLRVRGSGRAGGAAALRLRPGRCGKGRRRACGNEIA